LSDFPRALRAYTVALVALCVALAALAGFVNGWPAWSTVAVLGALAVLSEHQRVVLHGGIAISAGFMVGMTAIVVFRASDAPLGAIIVGALMGLYAAHLRKGRRGWLAFNAASCGLGYAAAAAAYWAIPPSFTARLPVGVLAAVPAALALVVVEATTVAVSFWVEERRPLRSVLATFGPTFVQVLPFALVGVLLGHLYIDVGWPVVLLLVVPVLCARDVFTSYLELHAAHEATVELLVSALEAKDAYTAGHAERVATFASYIGAELGLLPWRLERLHVAALMHDIGKLVVPNELLNKPDKLTSDEYARVRVHEQVSLRMLRHIELLAPLAEHAETLSYHRDDDSALEPFVIAVADAFDAMTSTRAYRRALTQEVAFQELRDKAGSQFHPGCVDALITAIERRGERYGAGHEDDASEFRVAPPDVGVGSAGLGDLLDGLGGLRPA
jgi:hypothetical protein